LSNLILNNQENNANSNFDVSSRFDLDILLSNNNQSSKPINIEDSHISKMTETENTFIKSHNIIRDIETDNKTINNNNKCTPFDMNIPLEFRINRDKLVLHEIVGSGGYSVVVRGE